LTRIFNHKTHGTHQNASPQTPAKSEDFRCEYEILKGKTSNGCLRLGGSSRFAQAKTTSCGSLKSMVCLFRQSEIALRDRKAHGKIFV